jgi:protocatechuate 3,4-dioxygenase beta subunit
MHAGKTSSFWFGAILASALLLMPVFPLDEADVLAAPPCRPTRADVEGPFYVPGAPIRTSTGKGLVIRGRLLGAPDCLPLVGGRIEWWQTDRRGRYDDAHRGSQNVDPDGVYRFETDLPGVYPGRPPHIHFKAFAPGYRTLTTQLYVRGGETEVGFDIVLAPAGNGSSEEEPGR